MVFKKAQKVILGCFLIAVILIILGVVFSGMIVKKIVSGVITQKTGVVQVNTQNVTGQSYVDPKTGATINLGVNKIPDGFPKDFPIYTGAVAQVSQTGNAGTAGGSGFWLTLTTADSMDAVKSFYETKLTENGWTTQSSTSTGTGVNWVVSKGSLGGYLAIAASENQTSIVIVLGEQK